MLCVASVTRVFPAPDSLVRAPPAEGSAVNCPACSEDLVLERRGVRVPRPALKSHSQTPKLKVRGFLKAPQSCSVGVAADTKITMAEPAPPKVREVQTAMTLAAKADQLRTHFGMSEALTVSAVVTVWPGLLRRA